MDQVKKNSVSLSFFGTPSERQYDTNCITRLVPKIKPDVDISVYKLQRLCKVCTTNLKNTNLSTKAKKYQCMFCWEAVCDDCSKVKVYSVNTNKHERICIACLNQEIEGMYKKELKEDFDNINQIYEEERKINNEGIEISREYLKGLKSLLDIKKGEIGQVGQSIQALEESIAELESQGLPVIDNKRKEKRLNRRKETFKRVLAEIEDNKTILSGMKLEIPYNDEEIRNLSSILEQIQAQAEYRKRFTRSAQERSILISQIIMHRGLSNMYEIEISKIKQAIEALDKKNDCLIQ
ncbi:hypothetical protein SteCoe_5123 [Stentor coeruleus]|uniref:FYVE-type domain-containing protein n=1 Tax=Stentor coeruleus TaxID=5963 RepID=A0A1R2CT21_9CILI|nr:hypothetical protein SteCoe_5123 [Stentor coeruleus]